MTLTWLYLSSYVLLFGAELNSELEHRTAQATTRRAAPIGERGAWVAGHVADGVVPTAAELAVAPSTAGRELVVIRVASRAGRPAGLPQVGWMPSVAATKGLSLLRRGKAVHGVVLLGAAAFVRFGGDRPQQRIKAVFFDVDGTLVDTNERHVAVWAEAFRQLNYTIVHDANRGQIGKGGGLLVSALLPGISRRVREDLSGRHGEVFKRDHLEHVAAVPAAAALLRRVHASGRRVILASLADAKEVAHYVARLGITDVTDATTTIDDAEVSKPSGDIFAAALKRLSR